MKKLIPPPKGAKFVDVRVEALKKYGVQDVKIGKVTSFKACCITNTITGEVTKCPKHKAKEEK